MTPFRPVTLPERIVALETEAEATARFKTDVESRLRRMERLMWGLVALQIGLKFLL
jgi:hypothetical protein